MKVPAPISETSSSEKKSQLSSVGICPNFTFFVFFWLGRSSRGWGEIFLYSVAPEFWFYNNNCLFYWDFFGCAAAPATDTKLVVLDASVRLARSCRAGFFLSVVSCYICGVSRSRSTLWYTSSIIIGSKSCGAGPGVFLMPGITSIGSLCLNYMGCLTSTRIALVALGLRNCLLEGSIPKFGA